MKPKYKAKITKAYLITIEDKYGIEVDHDWSFLNYSQTKQRASKMVDEVEQRKQSRVGRYLVQLRHIANEIEWHSRIEDEDFYEMQDLSYSINRLIEDLRKEWSENERAGNAEI